MCVLHWKKVEGYKQQQCLHCLSWAGVCLGQNGLPTRWRGGMCFIYKYSYVFTTNTEHSKAVPKHGCCHIVARSPTHTHTHFNTHIAETFGSMSSDLISNKHTANINSFRLWERRANWDRVTRRNLQPVCSAATAAAAAADAGFPCLFLPYMVTRVVE